MHLADNEDEVLPYFAKLTHASTDGGQAAIGRSRPGPGAVIQSYEEALNAWDLAKRLGLMDPALRAAVCSSTPFRPTAARSRPTWSTTRSVR